MTPPDRTERRQFPREPCRQPAEVLSDGGTRLSAVIRDFCPGGLFIEVDDVGQLERETSVTLAVPGFSSAVIGTIVRTSPEGAGVAFERPQYLLVEHLRKGPETEAPQRAKRVPAEQQGPLLEAVGEATLAYLDERLPRFLEDARERLIEEAEHAGSNIGQGVYFEAFTLLKRNGGSMLSRLRTAVARHLETFEDLQFSVPGGSEGELALVDEDEFEIWLAESEAASSAESRFHNQLHALEARLSVLRERRVDGRNNPLGPRALAHHAVENLKPLGLSIEALRIVIRSFGKMVLIQSGKLYDTVNDKLIEAGVLPTLPNKVKRKDKPPEREAPPADDDEADAESDTPPNRQSASTGGQRGGAGHGGAGRGHGGGGDVGGGAGGAGGSGSPGGGSSAAGGSESVAPGSTGGAPGGQTPPTDDGRRRHHDGREHPASTVIDIRDILRHKNALGGKPPYHAGPDDAKPLGHDELEEALAELESQAEDFANQRLEKRLGDAVARRFGKDSERRLDRDQQDAVFLTDEIVGTITSDFVLGERGKRWIKMLELPLVRTLLEEGRAIENPDHPVRQLFNLLGQVHDRPDRAMAPKEAQTLEKIEAVVSELSHSKALDKANLEAATTEIESLIKRQARRRETNTRRVLEACDGQERLESARHHVERLIAQQLAEEHVPKVLLDLVESGWRDLMALSAVREGHESTEVVEAAELIGRLNQRLTADASERDEAEDEGLLQQVSKRLELSGTDPTTQKRVLDQLKSLFAGESAVEKVDRPEPEPEPEEPEPTTPEESLWLGRAKLMDVGSWMLYPDESGQVRPLKLAWVNEDRDKYVFVGRDGQKALEIKPHELGEKLKTEEVDVADHKDEP
ncbi:MAG: DUF1631 family protein, partial [Xanthomonadales bacterium]|nr:DUF1631 family protein [Xanthomonadales bacterium]